MPPILSPGIDMFHVNSKPFKESFDYVLIFGDTRIKRNAKIKIYKGLEHL